METPPIGNILSIDSNTKPTLSSDQQKAFDLYLNGENIFLTGPAGTGKSYLIRKIVEHARGDDKNIAVSAMTGCAAVLLECGATTMHSWAGIGLATLETKEIICKIRSSPRKLKNWRSTNILIIDEVSMMSRRIFELLDQIGRIVRPDLHHFTRDPMNTFSYHRDKPFGGLQIICVGDFHQLPPVCKNNNQFDPNSQFCFESPDWETAFPLYNHILLTTSFRHNTDDKFQKILSQIRVGKLTRSSYDILLTHVDRERPTNFKPTILSPIKREVNQINQKEYNKIQEPEHQFPLKVTHVKLHRTFEYTSFQTNKSIKSMFSNDEKAELSYLADSMLCDPVVCLKKGSQVMCVINHSEFPLVNGSQGVIIDFQTGPTTSQPIPVVEFTNGIIAPIRYHTWYSEKNPMVGIKQIPLIYAWAQSIHKSQGSTLDMAEINAGSDIFAEGQSYVALSRVRTLDGLYLKAFDPSKILVNKKVVEFYQKISTLSIKSTPEQNTT
jgi:ATP-dependent DNA helicase PIF1